ncbi:MAG: ABC transporter ATP-binding protein [Alphaproteobacteria bacterium]|nr:ABC transporter ATP-binding protein [Alphaproteobacteria bacterium]
MTALLEAHGLSKAFGGVQAVQDVSLTVGAGEKVALIGPNGAGKSTLFDMLSGASRPDSGKVLFQGRDVTGLGADRRCRLGIGRTFQVAPVFASLTVRENVEAALLTARNKAFSPFGRLAAESVTPVLEEVGLADRADRPAAALDYANRKRLDFALAVAHRPALLLMDEPTAGTAREDRAEIMGLVDRLVAETGAGLLFTEHDMDVVFGHAERVLVLSRGRVIFDGAPGAARADAEVRAVYLGTGGFHDR